MLRNTNRLRAQRRYQSGLHAGDNAVSRKWNNNPKGQGTQPDRQGAWRGARRPQFLPPKDPDPYAGQDVKDQEDQDGPVPGMDE
jgi:hypothetical protein